MPHCELLGPLGLTDFHSRFRPRSVKEEGTVLKASGAFLSSDRRSLLVECVTAEGFLHQSFFIIATAQEGRVMVRLLPRTSPEKTEAVKRCLVWIARWIAAGSPGTAIGRTNLEELLQHPFPAEAIAP